MKKALAGLSKASVSFDLSIHRINQNQCQKKRRASQQERVLLGARFKVMCADAGLSIEETAKVLHVTTRTVRYWISGRVGIPYAAYRLVRVLGRYELPDPAWTGWVMHSGRLWSPEGHGFLRGDSSWWGRLVSQARLWREQYERGRQFDLLMLRAGRPVPDRGAPLAGGSGPALAEPTDAVGRAAQPPGPNLFKGHFGTRDKENAPLQRENVPSPICEQPLTKTGAGNE